MEGKCLEYARPWGKTLLTVPCKTFSIWFLFLGLRVSLFPDAFLFSSHFFQDQFIQYSVISTKKLKVTSTNKIKKGKNNVWKWTNNTLSILHRWGWWESGFCILPGGLSAALLSILWQPFLSLILQSPSAAFFVLFAHSSSAQCLPQGPPYTKKAKARRCLVPSAGGRWADDLRSRPCRGQEALPAIPIGLSGPSGAGVDRQLWDGGDQGAARAKQGPGCGRLYTPAWLRKCPYLLFVLPHFHSLLILAGVFFSFPVRPGSDLGSSRPL